DSGAFRVMLQVTISANRKHIPGGALIADKNEVLRAFERLQIGILHLAFLEQVRLLTGQRVKHLNMKESGRVQRFAQVCQRWSINENVLLPGDELVQSCLNVPEGLRSLRYSLGIVIIGITLYGNQYQKIPMIALTVTHQQRLLIARVLEPGLRCLQQIDHFQKLARRCLNKLSLVKIGWLRGVRCWSQQN